MTVRMLHTQIRGLKGRDVTVFAPANCVNHDTGATHQENKRRLEVLCRAGDGALRRAGLGSMQWDHEANPVVVSDLLRVHDWEYIQHVKARLA